MTVKDLIKKEVERLPESVLTEILDFIRFLELKQEKHPLANASQKLSETSFEKVWNNEEDAVYDNV